MTERRFIWPHDVKGVVPIVCDAFAMQHLRRKQMRRIWKTARKKMGSRNTKMFQISITAKYSQMMGEYLLEVWLHTMEENCVTVSESLGNFETGIRPY